MKKIRIGLAGLGTVGKGVYEILHKEKDLIDKRTKNKIELVAVSARSKKSFINDDKIKFYQNPLDLTNDPEVDVVVEVIGASEISKAIFENAIKKGKKIVTANKALIAEWGVQLAKLLEENHSHIGYEASVAGATPVIKMFREGLSANQITEFYGILNGTCNFILTRMLEEKISFEVALKQAQELGYAESDPILDINGADTAHKLAILGAIAGGTKPDLSKIYCEGIDKVTAEDIILANEFGYKIKLLAVYNEFGQAVYPALVSKDKKISQIDESFNAILVKSSNAEWSMLVGRGAGSLPTASGIVADLIDIANDRYSSIMYGVAAADLKEAVAFDPHNRVGKYFIQLILDKELSKNSMMLNNIFGDHMGEQINITKAHFIDTKDNIVAGFLTSIQQETDIINLLQNLDNQLVKASKFIRVEEIESF